LLVTSILAAFFGTAFFGAAFFAMLFFGAAFFGAAFFAMPPLGAAFFGAAFLGAVFFAVAFLLLAERRLVFAADIVFSEISRRGLVAPASAQGIASFSAWKNPVGGRDRHASEARVRRPRRAAADLEFNETSG